MTSYYVTNLSKLIDRSHSNGLGQLALGYPKITLGLQSTVALSNSSSSSSYGNYHWVGYLRLLIPRLKAGFDCRSKELCLAMQKTIEVELTVLNDGEDSRQENAESYLPVCSPYPMILSRWLDWEELSSSPI